MTDWTDPVIQQAEREMDYIDSKPDCASCRTYKALDGDTLCVYCRAEHPRQFDPRLENMSFTSDPRD